ncbi:MAG: 5-(carboxyamino)imidazole ribonucleotide synthase [Aquiluna sp.]
MRVGVIGGGQLARMMHPAAIALGVELRVFAESEGSSAVAATTKVGDYTDLSQVTSFASGLDVITFDHEHVPQQVLLGLLEAGVQVHPGPNALAHAQNKLVMRKGLAELGLPQPKWKEVQTPGELEEFLTPRGEVVVKTPIGGYDGKGVRVVKSAAEVADWFDRLPDLGGALLAEEKVEFKRELAQLVARRPSGQIASWPTVQTIQSGGVCSEVIAPAPNLDAGPALEIGKAVAEGLGVTGVLAVEMFEDQGGKLLVNELAMRPHNSGHFSIEAADTSQFEQHLRAVLELPLGSTELRAPAAVMVNLLGVYDDNDFLGNYQTAMAEFPEAKFHTYGKTARKGRKMGHITLLGEDSDQLLERGRAARSALYGEASLD